MKIDFADIFAHGIGWLIKQIVLFIAAVWFGCAIAGAAYLIGDDMPTWSLSYGDLGSIVKISPQLLVSAWMIPNILFLSAMWYRLIVNADAFGLSSWIILIGGTSLFSMGGATALLAKNWLPLSVAWGSWLLLFTMAAAALWFFFQWQTNRWARDLLALQAENSLRRAELKAEFGTEQPGAKDLGLL